MQPLVAFGPPFRTWLPPYHGVSDPVGHAVGLAKFFFGTGSKLCRLRRALPSLPILNDLQRNSMLYLEPDELRIVEMSILVTGTRWGGGKNDTGILIVPRRLQRASIGFFGKPLETRLAEALQSLHLLKTQKDDGRHDHCPQMLKGRRGTLTGLSNDRFRDGMMNRYSLS